LLDIKHYC